MIDDLPKELERLNHLVNVAGDRILKLKGEIVKLKQENQILKAELKKLKEDEPKEPTYRPYKDVDEFINDYKERFHIMNCPDYALPLILVKERELLLLITQFSKKSNEIFINEYGYSLKDLFRDFTYLDGTPCGKRED